MPRGRQPTLTPEEKKERKRIRDKKYREAYNQRKKQEDPEGFMELKRKHWRDYYYRKKALKKVEDENEEQKK